MHCWSDFTEIPFTYATRHLLLLCVILRLKQVAKVIVAAARRQVIETHEHSFPMRLGESLQSTKLQLQVRRV